MDRSSDIASPESAGESGILNTATDDQVKLFATSKPGISMNIGKDKRKDESPSLKKPKRIMSLSSGSLAPRVALNDKVEQSENPQVSMNIGEKRKAENESSFPRKIMSLSSGSMAPHIPLNDNVESSEKSKTDISLKIEEKRKGGNESPLPRRIMSLSSGRKAPSKPLITIKVASKGEKEKTEAPLVQKKKGSVAKAFAEDSDSEEEEMPKEARMRMRNIGRETPTSAGPNSYSKGKLGFTNRNKLFEMSLKSKLDPEKPLG